MREWHGKWMELGIEIPGQPRRVRMRHFQILERTEKDGKSYTKEIGEIDICDKADGMLILSAPKLLEMCRRALSIFRRLQTEGKLLYHHEKEAAEIEALVKELEGGNDTASATV